MSTERAAGLVGREAELEALARHAKKSRVVGVTGTPGIGKSALVRGWVAKADKKAAPALLVSLSGVSTLDAVYRELARVLRLPAAPSITPTAASTTIARALAQRGRLVLVLDDVDAARPVLTPAIAGWLADAPQVTFVVTSRARLAIPGEARLDLAPLEVPRARETDAAAIARSDAVKLFALRAAAIRPGYRLPRSAARSVAQIVRRVEGIPLAIELCASRMNILSEKEIEELLEAQVGLFAAPSVRRSLGAAIAWSWDQLEDEDAALLARCSVFRGGFDLPAAKAVAGEGDGAAASLALIEGLTRLEEASLLRVTSESPEEARRYSVPNTIGAFAREKLAERGETRERALRHARHYGAFAERKPPLGIEALSLERDNLDVAFQAAVDAGDRPLAARVLVALRPLVLARGPIAPYLARLDALLEGGSLPARDLAELRLARGLGLVFRGRRDEALLDLAEARKLARKARLPEVDVLATSKSGLVLGLKGDVRGARKLLGTALAEATQLGAPLLEGIVRKDLANVLSETGEDDEALVQLSVARDLFHAAGDAREEGFALMMAGTRLFDQGQLEDARRDLGTALGILQEVGDARSETWTRAMLALVDLERGEHRGARVGLEHALVQVRIVGDEHTEGLLCTFLGAVSLEQRMLTDAEASYRDARRLLAAAEDKGAEALATACTAFVEAELGRFVAARASMTRAKKLLEGDARAARAKAIALLELGVTLREATTRDDEAADAARSAVEEALATSSRGESEEVRFARRLLRTLHGETNRASSSSRAELLVARDGSWVKLPAGGAPVRLGRARAPRLLVQRLADERIRYPGRPVSPQALVRAGWPDERILPAAAKNRLHVTIARLRRIGLEGVLLHDEGGYVLDATLPTRIVDDDAADL